MTTTTNDQPLSGTDVIGQTVGASYIVEKVLGDGGMATVYLARSEELGGKLAAVKAMTNEMARKREAISRFRAEAYAAGAIDSPYVVQVFDTGQLLDGRPYMLMQYCSGGSLAQLLAKRGPLPFDLALSFALYVADVLSAAHLLRITHRDIKPANILLVMAPDGQLQSRVSDFGIAKLHEASALFDLKTGTKKTLGSPGYWAPEQCRDELIRTVDHRADIYSFATVIYEMFTGRRPYDSNNLFDLYVSVANNRPYPMPSTLRPELPRGLDDVMARGLAHRAGDRYDSVKELILDVVHLFPNGYALTSYCAPRFVTSIVPPTSPTLPDGIGSGITQWVGAHSTVSKPRRMNRAAVAMATVGLVTGVGVTAAVMHRGNEPYGTISSEGSRIAPAANLNASSTSTVATAAAVIDAGRIDVDAATVAKHASDAAMDGVTVASVPTDAAPDAPSRIPVAPPDAPTVPPATPTTAIAVKEVHPSTHHADVPAHVVPAEPGYVRVEVDPWAEVTVAGLPTKYTTPVTIELSSGPHRIVLKRNSQTETLNVMITSKQTTQIKRSW